MSDPEAWGRAVRDVLNWTAPILPVKLGWVLVAAGIVWAIVSIIKAWRGNP